MMEGKEMLLRDAIATAISAERRLIHCRFALAVSIFANIALIIYMIAR